MSAMPLSLRHRPGPYASTNRSSSRIDLPVAIKSIDRISPTISKCTPRILDAKRRPTDLALSGREPEAKPKLLVRL